MKARIAKRLPALALILGWAIVAHGIATVNKPASEITTGLVVVAAALAYAYLRGSR